MKYIMDLIATRDQKKQLLINILEAINPYRDLAEWLLILIKSIDEEFIIDSLLSRIQTWIKVIKSTREREKIKNEIKEVYVKNNTKIQQDKNNAEKVLEDFINNI